MIECELCDNWYHPQCIGINEHDDVKLNLMYIVCSLCRVEKTQEFADGDQRKGEPGSDEGKLRKNDASGEDWTGKPKMTSVMGNKMQMNTTSVDMILSRTNLNLSDFSKKDEPQMENTKNVVNIISQSKEGNVFRISLNQNKGDQISEQKEGELLSEMCPKRDLKIIEPFSDIKLNKMNVRSTEDLARTQTRRVNKIFSRYYPTDADKSSLKKLKKLMVSKNEEFLKKRRIQESCLRGKNCVKKSKFALKFLKKVKYN